MSTARRIVHRSGGGSSSSGGGNDVSRHYDTAVSLPSSTAVPSVSVAATNNNNSSSSGSFTTIDRDVFAAPDFSSATFVNNISSRVLFPVLQRHRQSARRGVSSNNNNSSSTSGSNMTTTMAGAGSDASSQTAATAVLHDGAHDTVAAAAATATRSGDVDYVAVASTLAATLDEAEGEVTRLLHDEAAALRQREVHCRRVEIREKRRLAQVRLGLEATTARLHEYDNLVGNAQAATAGIETHLAQSNARVQRGRAVHKLLRFLKMFIALQPGELATLLRALSKARATQRAAVTAQWQRGRVSHYNPRYYTTTAATTSASRSATAPDAPPREGNGEDDVVVVNVSTRAATTTRQQQRDGNKVTGDDDGDDSDKDNKDDDDSGSSSSGSNDKSEDGSGGARRGGEAVVMRAEAAAMAAGLDRLFALRRYTEAQVTWAQKLQLLASELGALVQHTGNVGVYVAWLRQELVADLLHLIARFNEFYDGKGEAAVHLGYGRALLRTLALVSRLYSNMTPSSEALLSVFFAHMINDMAVTLFSEHTPTPLPAQPPLPLPTPLLAMDHLARRKDEYADAFAFVLQRVRRDVVVVEVVFGNHYSNILGGGGDAAAAATAEARTTTTAASVADEAAAAAAAAATVLMSGNATATAAGAVTLTSAMAVTTARQQLLARVTEGVVRPFIVQQRKLAETHRAAMLSGEAALSPRGRRRCGARVADAMAYHHAVAAHLFTLFVHLVDTLRRVYGPLEADVVARYTDVIFADRVAYGHARDELALLRRYHTLLDEHYTRALHPLPDELFDLREAHMAKARALLDRLGEVATRVRVYAPPRLAGPYVGELLLAGLRAVAEFLSEELAKAYETLRGDRDRWRLRPAAEEELLRPSRPEAQQCGLRMLLFALSTLMSFRDVVAVLSMPLLKTYPRLLRDYDDARGAALEQLDERAERLLNLCVQAMVVRSLSILLHYQGKNDYLPRSPPPPPHATTRSSNTDKNSSNSSKADDGDAAAALAPSCTRACTLFCYYVTRQFDEAKEFIRLSNGQLPLRLGTAASAALMMPPSSSQQQQRRRHNSNSSSSNISGSVSQSQSSWASQSAAAAFAATTPTASSSASMYSSSGSGGNNSGGAAEMAVFGAVADGFSLLLSHSTSPTVSAREAVRARARTMNLQQLLYGDGGPSSFVRTVGVCLYRGLVVHLKSMTANDRGALVYKQDVTAYKEAMAPLTSTPGLGGAVVDVLFTLLKETSSLLLMPLDHIHAVKMSGMLRLLSNEEKVRFLRIRQDMRAAFKIIEQ